MFDWLSDPHRPNSFTLAMGDLIRQARLERGMSQEDLAEKIYKRRPSISEMENGKMEPSAGDLYMLALVLKKPITYFFGKRQLQIMRTTNPEVQALTPEQEEILMLFNRLKSDALHKTALNQLHTLVELAQGKYEAEEDSIDAE